jgi:serine/threonine-protein kinase RsbW
MTATDLHVEASLGELAGIRARIRSAAETLGVDPAAVGGLVQAVDEWVANVIVHGYRGAAGQVHIHIQRDGKDIVVRIRDSAPVFDPATAPAFDPDLPLEQRPLGHLGIALIRELCTVFDHRALPDGGNEVTLRRPAAAAGRKGGAT